MGQNHEQFKPLPPELLEFMDAVTAHLTRRAVTEASTDDEGQGCMLDNAVRELLEEQHENELPEPGSFNPELVSWFAEPETGGEIAVVTIKQLEVFADSNGLKVH